MNKTIAYCMNLLDVENAIIQEAEYQLECYQNEGSCDNLPHVNFSYFGVSTEVELELDIWWEDGGRWVDPIARCHIYALSYLAENTFGYRWEANFCPNEMYRHSDVESKTMDELHDYLENLNIEL